ncbi:Sperm-associated antigen 1 [Holothuria leucospilota]|uniref:Sperm-associated antigen 1 n=1 Tax=Holothuria leucospilota TaxID=206669 RepID=A0A9Q0YD40_HOLLE|nr:Sperm-associated antigen 1 [Holothuria leucospilota]
MDAGSIKHLLGGSGEVGDVPVEHMDYDYISESSNVKELEKILKVLRSGKEGYYPDLIKHCENRIRQLNPQSKALRKDKAPATPHDLGQEEWKQVNTDMKNFLDEAHSTDQSMKDEGPSEDKDSIPVRGSVTIDSSGKKDKENSEPDFKPFPNRIRSHDFRAWEKYDADKESERVDESDEMKQTRLQADQLKESRSSASQEKLKTEGCTPKELEMMANREKDKGNEAFRAGDFAEAILYYTRSLSVIPSAPAYNNRALARIRLEQFPSAVVDCNKVLELEPDNLKAMLRRSTARKSLHQYEEACQDLEYVLSIEPGNKQAEDLLKDVKKKMMSKPTSSHKIQNGHGKGAPKGGKRMVIEEVEGSDSSEGDVVDGNITSQQKSPEGVGKDTPYMNGESPKEKISPGESSEEKTSPEETGGNPEVAPSNVSANKVLQAPKEIQTQSPKMTTEAVQTSPTDIDKKVPGTGETPKEEDKLVPTKPLPQKVVKLKDEGTALYMKGQYDHAKEKYSKALELLKEDEASYKSAISSLYSNRAACRLKVGDCQGCIEDCDTVLQLTPFNIKGYLRRASAYETLEKYKYAYVDFQQAMTFDPYNKTAQAGATRTMGVLQSTYGTEWRQKLPSRPLIPAASPQQPKVSVPQENGPSGEATDGNSVLKAAAPTREKAEKIPEKPLSNEEKFQKLKSEGNDFVKKGQYKDAIRCYTACTEIDPAQAVPFTNRALCYLKLNQNAQAEEDCTRALQLDPKNVKGYYRRAQARKGLDNYFDSIKDLTALLKLESNNVSAKKELEIVKDAWRKKLREKQSNAPTNSTAESKADISKKKNVLIEEADTDSEDEKDEKPSEGSAGRPGVRKNGLSEGREKEPVIKEEKSGKHSGHRESKPTEKHKNSRSKSKKEEKDGRNSKMPHSTQAPKLSKVTAYEFMQAWMSLKSTKDSLPYAQLLEQVPPDQLPTVLSNKLDAPMLTKILKAVEDHLVKSDPERSYRLLSNLCRAQRFQTVLLFMTNEEKQGIDKCLASLAAKENQFCSNEDIDKLRKSFGLIC